MKEFFRGPARILLDLRLIVGVCGVLLSIVMHELFHIILHWGEIQDINLFPDSHAIVEVIFTPAGDFDLLIEEAFAYCVMMVTLVLTAMLIGDINDVRGNHKISHVITKDIGKAFPDLSEQQAIEHLARILGVGPQHAQISQTASRK